MLISEQRSHQVTLEPSLIHQLISLRCLCAPSDDRRPLKRGQRKETALMCVSTTRVERWGRIGPGRCARMPALAIPVSLPPEKRSEIRRVLTERDQHTGTEHTNRAPAHVQPHCIDLSLAAWRDDAAGGDDVVGDGRGLSIGAGGGALLVRRLVRRPEVSSSWSEAMTSSGVG